jgi:predicted HicB family RNase H-like nuclease
MAKSPIFPIRIEPALKKAAEQQAKKEGVPLAALIKKLLAQRCGIGQHMYDSNK